MDEIYSRRDFFKKLPTAIKELVISKKSEKTQNDKFDWYFKSSMCSYPLLQEMPWDMLCEEAAKCNIVVEGRSKNDIMRDLFSIKYNTDDEKEVVR